MEPLLETIELDIEESNELKFKIKLEGNVSSPAKVRLVCEGDEFSYVFKGYGTGEMDVVQFTLPRMESKLKEGTYNAKVEVLVENRYFAPLQFQINFKKRVTVVAESIKVLPRPPEPEIKVTAAPIVVARPLENSIQFERKPKVVENRESQSNTIGLEDLVPPREKVLSLSERTRKNSEASSLKEAYIKKKITQR